MSIQKPIQWSKIKQVLHDVPKASDGSISIKPYRGKIIWDTDRNEGRRLPRTPNPISASDFEHAELYQEVLVKSPQLEFTRFATPRKFEYDSGKLSIKIKGRFKKPPENAQWGNAIPSILGVSVMGGASSDISVTPDVPPAPDNKWVNFTVTFKVPTDIDYNRSLSVTMALTYKYPTNPTDSNWINNQSSQASETFLFVSGLLTLFPVNSNPKPVVSIVDTLATRGNYYPNTFGTVTKYRDKTNGASCGTPDTTTKRRWPSKSRTDFTWDINIPGQTTKMPDGYTHVNSHYRYKVTYYTYDPDQPQFSPMPPSTLLFDSQSQTDDTKSHTFAGLTKTMDYSTPGGIGGYTVRLDIVATATYEETLTGTQFTSTDSLLIRAGTHTVTRSLNDCPVVEPGLEAFHTNISLDYQIKEHAITGDRGMEEYDSGEIIIQFTNAVGKTFNVYIGGDDGTKRYIGGISTGQYGVPQFSPSVSKTWQVPASQRIKIPFSVLSGSTALYNGPGSPTAILEYVEDGKGKYPWRGTTNKNSTSNASQISSIAIDYAGQALLTQGLYVEDRSRTGSGALITVGIVNGKVHNPQIVKGGSGYKVGDQFIVSSLSFGGTFEAILKVTGVGGSSGGIDMSPDAATIAIPTIDKPYEISGSYTGGTSQDEGTALEFEVSGTNLHPSQLTGTVSTTFPSEAINSGLGTFTIGQKGGKYFYKSSVGTVHRENHYEDITGSISGVHDYDGAEWFNSGPITLVNLDEEDVPVVDPEIVNASLSVHANNRQNVGPAGTAEITTHGSIVLNIDGTFTKRVVNTGGMNPGSSSNGVAVEPTTQGNAWVARITPRSGSIDSWNIGDVDLWFDSEGHRGQRHGPQGSFTRSLSAGNRSFSLGIVGEQVRWREAQLTGSASWELYNTSTKEIKSGGSMSGFAGLYVGQGTPSTGGPPVVTGTPTQTTVTDTLPPTGTTIPATDPGVTWCADGNRYKTVEYFPFVILVRMNDPTCEGDDFYTTQPATTTRRPVTTTRPPVTTEPTTFCDVNGNRVKIVGSFPNLSTQIVVRNDPTCDYMTTAPPVTTTRPPVTTTEPTTFCDLNGNRVKIVGAFPNISTQIVVRNDPTCNYMTVAPPTTRPPTTTQAGPAAGTEVPNTRSCFKGTLFYSVYTGIGYQTTIKSFPNHRDCVVATTQPPATTTRRPPATTTKAPVTVSFRFCEKVWNLNTGNQIIVYSDGTRETIRNEDACPLLVFTTPPPTTQPPTTRPPFTTRRPGLDPVRGWRNR